MADMKGEYIDVRGRTHTVEHIIVQAEDQADRERMIEELFCALAGRCVSNSNRPVCPKVCGA